MDFTVAMARIYGKKSYFLTLTMQPAAIAVAKVA